MGKVKTIPFKQFMSGEYQDNILKVKEVRKKRIYKVALVSGLTLMVFLTGFESASAAMSVANNTGIEHGANAIYDKLLVVGKWIIIGKGAISTINHMLQEDHGAAKRGFLTYLVIYVILHGLPWALGQVDIVFNQV